MDAGGRSAKTKSPKKKAGKGPKSMDEKKRECAARGGTFFPKARASKHTKGICVADCSTTQNPRLQDLCGVAKKPRRAVKAAAKGKGGKKAESAPRKAASTKTGLAEKRAREEAAEKAQKALEEAKLAAQRASAEAKKEAKEKIAAARKAAAAARREAAKPVKSLPGKQYTAAELKKEVAKVETDSDLFRKLDALRENGAREDLQRHDSALRHLIQTAKRKLSGGRRKRSSGGRKRSSRCKKKGYVRRRTPRAKAGCVKRSTAQKEAAAFRKRSGKRRR